MKKFILIREATQADARVILDMIRELADFEKLSNEAVATEATILSSLFGPRPAAETLIAESSDALIIGFALYFTSYSTFLGRAGLYLEDLYVREAARGTGAGSALLRRLAVIAKERGCGRLEWSVLDWNEKAIEFYKSLGAASQDGWTRYRMTAREIDDLAGST